MLTAESPMEVTMATREELAQKALATAL